MTNDEIAKELDDGRYIEAEWVMEKGRWDKERGDYVDLTREASTALLRMVIKVHDKDGRHLIHFERGPTGFETYRVQHLLENPEFGKEDDDTLCICAGAINRWPVVTVNAKQVRKFLEEQMNAWRVLTDSKNNTGADERLAFEPLVRAFRVTCKGRGYGIYFAETADKAKLASMWAGRAAGYQVQFSDLRVRRAPEFDARKQLIRLTPLQNRMLLALRQYTRPGSGEWVPNIKFGGISKQACAVLCRQGLATRHVHSEQVRGERRVKWTLYQITDAGLRHLAA